MSIGHLLIRASAGSGKTFQLSSRYLRLLLAGESPAHMLASTFTRKAAAEILDRVFLRLAKGCESETECEKLASELEQPLDLETLRAHLARFVGELDRVQISTIDAFFARLATAFGMELELPPGWHFLDEAELPRLRLDAIRGVIDANEAQLKTLLLYERGNDPRGVRQRLDELLETLHSLYVESSADAWSRVPRTEHLGPPLDATQRDALARRVGALPAFGHKSAEKGIQADVDLVRRGDYRELIRKGLARKLLDGADDYYRKPIPAEIRACYEEVLDAARRTLLTELARRNKASFQLLEQLDQGLQPLKLSRGSLSFDDLGRVLGVAERMGSLEEIFYRLDARTRHLLLDEFQDTSREQWQVLRPLVHELAARDDEQSVFVVGDAKQAIYRWRGGEAEIFRRLDEELRLSGDSVQSLDKSYRSSQVILDAVNATFSTLDELPALEGWIDEARRWQADFQPHESAKPQQAGEVVLHATPEVEDKKGLPLATLRRAAAVIRELSERHPGVTIGVLLRTNARLTRLHFELTQLGVHASEEGGVSLARHSAVDLLLSVLRLAANPGHRVAQFHLATSPLAPTLQLDAELDTASADRLSRRVRRRIVSQGYGGTLLELAKELAPHCSKRSVDRLLQLVEAGYRYDGAARTPSLDFVDWIEGGRSEEPTPAAVRLMTLHKAKGLQFPIVVLCDLENRLAGSTAPKVLVGRDDRRAPPNRISQHVAAEYRALDAELVELHRQHVGEELAEQLSLLYVGMTRASHALHFVLQPEGAKSPTQADIVRQALCGEAPLVAGEDRLWGEPKAIEFPAEEQAESLEDFPALELAASTRERARSIETPSGAEAAGISLAQLLRPGGDDSFRRRGLALHGGLETVGFLEDGEPEHDRVRAAMLRAVPDASTQELAAWLDEFWGLLNEPDLRDVLARQYYQRDWGEKLHLELWRERSFAVLDSERILRGRFDRVVLGCSASKVVRAHVVDYKSDRIPPEDEGGIAVLQQRYAPQLHEYRRAVARRSRISEESIACSILLLNGPQLVDVDAG